MVNVGVMVHDMWGVTIHVPIGDIVCLTIGCVDNHTNVTSVILRQILMKANMT